MKFLIDMNLTPEWVSYFEENGFSAAHWYNIGEVDATDKTIMDYACQHGFIVFTHDLDFGNILAATGGSGPSVIQIRINDTTPAKLGPFLFNAIKQFKNELKEGALVTLVPGRMKARILPLMKK